MIHFSGAGNYVVSYIKDGNDDVEEYTSNGEMYFDSSDLEIVWESPYRDNKDEQTIGLRYTAQIMSPEEIKTDLNLITYNGARCLNIQDRYGLDVGKDANFIVLDGDSPFDVIRNRAKVLASVRKGEYLFKQKPVEYDVKLDLGVNY